MCRLSGHHIAFLSVFRSLVEICIWQLGPTAALVHALWSQCSLLHTELHISNLLFFTTLSLLYVNLPNLCFKSSIRHTTISASSFYCEGRLRMKTTLMFDGENNLDVSELSNKGNVETHTNTKRILATAWWF